MTPLTDPVSELAVLSAVYHGGFKAYADVADLLAAPDTFAVPANQAWWAAVRHVFTTNPHAVPDASSLLQAAAAMGTERPAEGRSGEQLRALTRKAADPANARAFAARVKKLHAARTLVAVLDEAKADLLTVTGDEPMAAVMAKVEGRVLEFGSRVQGESDGPVRLGAVAADYFERVMSDPGPKGVPTGFPKFDFALGGGILPNSVDMVCGRAKNGKSMLKMAMCLNIAGRGVPVLDINTELTIEEELDRVGGNLSGVESNAIRDGLCDEAERAAVREAAARLATMPYYHIMVANMPFPEVLATIRRWFLREVGLDANGRVRPCVVFYDYLKLTGAGDGGDWKEYQTLGFMATELKNLMARYGGRCVAFGQMNREGLDFDDERAVAGSDRLSWFGTSLSFLRWLSDDEKAPIADKTLTHGLLPVLARRGPRWGRKNFVALKTDLSRGRMEEGPTRDELATSGQVAAPAAPKRGARKANAAETPVPFG